MNSAINSFIKACLSTEPSDELLEALQDEKLYGMLQNQQIVPLIIPHFNQLTLNENNRKKWKENIYRNVLRFEQIGQLQNEITLILEENRVSWATLKGFAAAYYYRTPYQRVLGDIDLLVTIEDYQKAADLLLQHGFVQAPDDNRRHMSFTKNNVDIELHRYFSLTDECSDIDQYLQKEIAAAQLVHINGITFRMLPVIANGIVLLEHIANHIAEGVGYRQILDFSLFAEKELNSDEFISRFLSTTEKFKIKKLALATAELARTYLGIPVKNVLFNENSYTDAASELIELVQSDGNFGNERNNELKRGSTFLLRSNTNALEMLQRKGKYNLEADENNIGLSNIAFIYQMYLYVKALFRRKKPVLFLYESIREKRKRLRVLRKLGLSHFDWR